MPDLDLIKQAKQGSGRFGEADHYLNDPEHWVVRQ